MFLTIIFLPFFSFLILSLFGRFIGKRGSAILSVLFMAFVIILSLFGFYDICIVNNIYFVDLAM